MGPYYDHQVGRFEAPDREILLARARHARSRAFADVFGGLYTGLKAATRAVAGFVRYAGAGAAMRPPCEDFGHGTARLTGGCK
jgi:hypothetical protein